MQTNALPHYDESINTTGCCPKFNPEGWDNQDLHFKNKPFVRATTRSAAYVPLDMGDVFARVHASIDKADARQKGQFIAMSHDLSPFKAEHLFAVSAPVAGEEMASLSGDFVTKVFEGSFQDAGTWHREMKNLAESRGAKDKPVWFFYTTCPNCAKAYGQNYVIGLAAI